MMTGERFSSWVSSRYVFTIKSFLLSSMTSHTFPSKKVSIPTLATSTLVMRFRRDRRKYSRTMGEARSSPERPSAISGVLTSHEVIILASCGIERRRSVTPRSTDRSAHVCTHRYREASWTMRPLSRAISSYISSEVFIQRNCSKRAFSSGVPGWTHSTKTRDPDHTVFARSRARSS